MGGTGKKFNGKNRRKSTDSNLIWLYPREHFIAHKILATDNPDDYKLVNAWTAMAYKKKSGELPRYEITPEEYEELKNIWSKVLSENNPASRPEVRSKISKSLKGKMVGDKNPFYGHHHTEESINQIIKNRPDMSGENNPMYKRSSLEGKTKEEISEIQLKKHKT